MSLLLPLFVAPLAACSASSDKSTDDTDVVDTDVDDTDVVDTDVEDTDVVDTDVEDTDVVDTDLPAACDDGAPAADQLCFATPAGYEGEGTIGALAIADWNGGGADVIYAISGSVYTLAGDGSGAFPSGGQVSGTYMGSPVRELQTGQLNSDSYPDVAVGGVNTNGRAIFGDGAGGIAYESNLTGEGSLLMIHVADIVGSGPTDDLLSTADSCGGIVMTSGTANESYKADYEYLCNPENGALAKTSSAHSSAVTAQGTTLSTATITADTSSFTLGTAATLTLPAASVDMDAADLDGDGDDEVLVLLADGTLKVLFADGADGWETQGAGSWVSYTLSGGPTDMAIGDLDGDGDPDVAIGATTDDAITVLVNDGAGAFTSTPLSTGVGSAPVRVAVGDLNGDDVDDIVAGVALANEIAVLLSTP